MFIQKRHVEPGLHDNRTTFTLWQCVSLCCQCPVYIIIVLYTSCLYTYVITCSSFSICLWIASLSLSTFPSLDHWSRWDWFLKDSDMVSTRSCQKTTWSISTAQWFFMMQAQFMMLLYMCNTWCFQYLVSSNILMMFTFPRKAAMCKIDLADSGAAISAKTICPLRLVVGHADRLTSPLCINDQQTNKFS